MSCAAVFLSLGGFAACTVAETPQTEYRISFFDEDTLIDSVQTAGHETIVLPNAPAKQNFVFQGWYFDRGIWKSPFFADTYAEKPLTENVSVYAYYQRESLPEPEPQKYSVRFETNGGSAVEGVTASVIETSPKTEKSGFTFVGWYTEEGFVNKIEFPYTVTQETVLYAKWEQNAPAEISFSVSESGELTAVHGISGSGVQIKIPQTVNAITVKRLAGSLFANNASILSVEMPDTVTSIGYAAFSGCRNLQSVRLSNSLTSIAASAFENCVSLKEISLPNGLREIRSDAFRGSGLQSVVCPSSLKEIWQYAFADCMSLTRADVSSVRSIAKLAFENCSSLTEIDLPNGGLMLDKSVLKGTGIYKNASNWKNGALYADGYLIEVNQDFAAVNYTVQSGTVAIAENAFSYGGLTAQNLISLVLPEGVRFIGAQAFKDCKKLAEIRIPSTVVEIGFGALDGTAYYANEKNWQNNGLYAGEWLIAVKDVAMTSFMIQEGTVGVANASSLNGSMFGSAARAVSEIAFPTSLRYIGAYAFAKTAVASAALPAGLVTIGEYAFNQCAALSSVNTGDCASLVKIGQYAFSGAKLTRLDIPSATAEIGRFILLRNSVPVTVYCAVREKPADWDADWSTDHGGNVHVVWSKSI